MRIAFVLEIFYPERNGVVTATINLAKNLMAMGHDVWFFVPENKEFTEPEIEDGIHICYIKGIPFPIYHGLRVATEKCFTIANILKTLDIDIVHLCTPGFMGRTMNNAANMGDIPVVATHHTLIDDVQYIQYVLKSENVSKFASRIVWNEIYKPIFKKVWVATAPAEYTCQGLRTHFPFLDVRYISNGIDVSRFGNGGYNESCPLPESIPLSWVGDKTFIYVGRLGFEKSIDILLNAFSMVVKKHKEAKLICIGGGPADETLKEIIKKDNLENNVLMTGLIPNEVIIGSGVLKMCRAFVTASTTENQAMTVIEALCSGLPVICANVPNMTSIVGKDMGWFFEGKNVADLALTIEDAFLDDSRDDKAKAAAASKERFDGKNVTCSFVSLYEEVLQKKRDGWRPKGWKKYRKYV